MRVVSRFFDNNEWSIYATIQTLIPLIILRLGKQDNTLKYLVMSSLIAMMEGNVIDRAVYSFFLSLMVWQGDLVNTTLTVIAAIITGMIPYNNIVHKYIMSSKILTNIAYLVIIIWCIFILYLIKKTVTQ